MGSYHGVFEYRNLMFIVVNCGSNIANFDGIPKKMAEQGVRVVATRWLLERCPVLEHSLIDNY